MCEEIRSEGDCRVQETWTCHSQASIYWRLVSQTSPCFRTLQNCCLMARMREALLFIILMKY